MNQYTNSLLSAIGIVAEKRLSDAGFSKIVDAVITDASNASEGKYVISYQNASRSARSDNPNYKAQDVVSVLMPGATGDPWQILSLSKSGTVETELKDSWEDSFDRLDTKLFYQKENINTNTNPFKEVLYQFNEENSKVAIDNTALIKSIKETGYFLADFNLEYNFDNLLGEEKIDLNYGLVFIFNDEQEFKFDINDILSSPFITSGLTSYKKVFEVKNVKNLNYLKEIYVFVEFPSLAETPSDFSFTLSDLTLYGAAKANYDSSAVTIIEVKDGLSFDGADSLDFSCYLRENNIKVLDTADFRYYWAISNRNRTSSIFGQGWEEVESGSINPTLTLASSKITRSNVSLAAAIKKLDGSTIVSKTKTIYQDSSKAYDFELKVYSGSKTTEKILSVDERYGKENVGTVTYDWYHIDAMGNETNENNTNRTLTIDLTKIKGSWIYGCRVSVDGLFIEDVSRTLDMELAIATGRVRVEGAGVYFYNMGGERQGKSPNALKARFFSDNGDEITAFKLEWLVPKTDTMIVAEREGADNENADYLIYRDDGSKTFKFKLKSKYNVKADQNTIIARVEELGTGFNYEGQADIGILRTGAPGTNGTDVMCVISPNINSANQGYPEFIQVRSTDSLTYSTRLINIGTGEEMSTSEYVIQYKVRKQVEGKSYWAWENLQDPSILTSEATILQAQVCELDDNYEKGEYPESKVKYRAFLPIAHYTDDDYINPFRLKPNAGFTTVLYSSASTNPSYSENEFEFTSDASVDTTQSYAPLSVTANDKGQFIVTAPAIYNIEDSQKQIAIAFKKKDSDATITIPFLFLKNAYENAVINGWDGDSILMDEESGTILSPMAGFGQKEDDNSFTGVLLGKSTGEDEKVGIFGRGRGKETFFFDANTGAAYLGEAGSGQIRIIPNQDQDNDGKPDAIIEGGTFLPALEKDKIISESSYNAWLSLNKEIESSFINQEDGTYKYTGDTSISGYGMQLNLTKPSIEWGNGSFKIDEQGNLTLKGHIDAVSGTIAGFSINGDKIEKGNTGLSSGGDYAFWSGDNFLVTHNGEIVAISGKIGNFTIGPDGFYGPQKIEENSSISTFIINTQANDTSLIAQSKHDQFIDKCKISDGQIELEQDSGSSVSQGEYQKKSLFTFNKWTIDTSKKDGSVPGGSIEITAQPNVGSVSKGEAYIALKNSSAVLSSGEPREAIISPNGFYQRNNTGSEFSMERIVWGDDPPYWAFNPCNPDGAPTNRYFYIPYFPENEKGFGEENIKIRVVTGTTAIGAEIQETKTLRFSNGLFMGVS